MNKNSLETDTMTRGSNQHASIEATSLKLDPRKIKALRRSVEREAERKRLVALSPKEARFRRLAYRMITEYAFARVDGVGGRVKTGQLGSNQNQPLFTV